ncbi:MAG: hypothetical protein MUP67_11785, partial [Acidimicrobiia bacterium]|nr:hypothetical protein [Acidimicrobiia bacterium]
LDTIAVADMVSWPYPDAGALLGRRLGITHPLRTVTTTTGGNSPQMLVNTFAAEVAAGRCRAVLIGGAECVHSRWRARREPKVWFDWTEDDAPPCAEVVGDDRPGSSEYEDTHAANAPTIVYPLFETALRHAAGRDVDAHQRFVGDLWATFADVAAENPAAWSRNAWTAEEIRTVASDNRMVTFPYTKRMCANIDVDQAAAIILCSYETAVDLGVPDDRMVFPLSGADAHDHPFFTERDRLDRSPAVSAASNAALDAAGIGLDDVARFDLYSCFPSAVQITMGSLGLGGPAAGDRRPLTVTGGLGFAGGPANNYVTHSIARMVEELRRDPGSIGFVHAIGWYATKHAVGVYSTTPPDHGFERVDTRVLQAEIDALPRRVPAGAYSGSAVIEATAIAMDRDGSCSYAVVSLRAPDGRRVLAVTRHDDTMTSMTREPWEGRSVTVTTDGTKNRLAP